MLGWALRTIKHWAELRPRCLVGDVMGVPLSQGSSLWVAGDGQWVGPTGEAPGLDRKPRFPLWHLRPMWEAKLWVCAQGAALQHAWSLREGRPGRSLPAGSRLPL